MAEAANQKHESDVPAAAQNFSRAILNILEDFGNERSRLGDTQRAVLNILEDAAYERVRLESTQKAVLNILEDSNDEKAQLSDTHRATLNILEDFDAEKKKVDRINLELRKEVADRVRAEDALSRAIAAETSLRRANAATEAANRELEAFSYSVAHDLRAPLRSIDGFSQALLEDFAGRLDPEGTKYLQNVRESAQQMGILIDDLLSLSRVARSELRLEPADLSALARAVLAKLQGTQPDRRVDICIQEGLIATADPRLLDIALTNLFSNAWKFTRKRASARIEFAADAGNQPTVFFIRDNGAGFDQAYANKLFGVFQRLHTAHEFEGTGIGLATVQRIVRRHGGRIWAEGKVDAGATFYFTLEEEKA